MTYEDMPAETLIIGGWESRCNACGDQADPEETGHDTVLGVPAGTKFGCGTTWTHVYHDYKYLDGLTPLFRNDLIEVLPR